MSGKRKAIVLLSGGIDSAACAHLLLSKGFEISAIFVDFGQPAAQRELKSSRRIAKRLGLNYRVVKVSSDAVFGSGEMVGRNAFFVFAALLMTPSVEGVIALGVHASTPYYDCSPSFVAEIGRTLAHQTDGRVALFAPFISWSKRDIYDYFATTGLFVDETYSCERGTEPVCGRCASCLDREAL